MDYWFLLKKGVSVYLHPLTIGMEAIVTGLVLVGMSRRRRRRQDQPPGRFAAWLRRFCGDAGVGLIIGGVFFLYLCSIKPVAEPLVFLLEKRHPPLRLATYSESQLRETAPDYLVVLGGGEHYDPAKPPTSQLTPAALARTIEGVRLAGLFPRATVIFTGQPLETLAMKETALSLGVREDRLVTESESRDTQDHPAKVGPLMAGRRFFLITAGTHMPRAMTLFEAAGLHPVAAPCDLWVWPGLGEESPYRLENFIPRAEHLWMTHVAFHEYLGLAWVSLHESGVTAADTAAEEAGPAKHPATAAPALPLPLPN